MAGSVSSWIARSSLKDFPQFRYSSAAQLIGHCEIHHTERLSLESPADIAEAFNACFSTLANDKLLHSEIHADFGWVVLHFIQRSCPHGSDGFPPVDAHNNFRHVGSVWPCFPMQTSGQNQEIWNKRSTLSTVFILPFWSLSDGQNSTLFHSLVLLPLGSFRLASLFIYSCYMITLTLELFAMDNIPVCWWHLNSLLRRSWFIWPQVCT